jgi:ABC-type multidrug transport system fused ATPase/permease subunit
MAVSLANISYAVAVTIAILSTPSLSRLTKGSWKVNQINHEIYKDIDGVATKESVALYSTKCTFLVILVATATGLMASFALAGFALSLSLMYKRTILQAIRQLANMELNMNSAERIFEYTQLPIETHNGIEDLRASWPEEGKLEVRDLHVGYAEGSPSILKGLTFTCQMNQNIGVVGRTGAGKSLELV